MALWIKPLLEMSLFFFSVLVQVSAVPLVICVPTNALKKIISENDPSTWTSANQVGNPKSLQAVGIS